MTLRQTLGRDAERLHELLEELLDRENVVLLLFDGHRAINYVNGFGLSGSQHELMALAIERVVRAAGATAASEGSGRRSREEGSKSGGGARVRERLGGDGGQPNSSVVHGTPRRLRSGDRTHRDRGVASRRVLQLASMFDAPRSG